MNFKLTDHEKDKITKQIVGIQGTIRFTNCFREKVKQFIIEEIFNKSNSLNVNEKKIELHYINVPSEFVSAIKKSRLDKKVGIFYNIALENLNISREIGNYISNLNKIINYIFTLIVFAHPERVVKKKISDKLKSLKKNKSVLFGRILRIISSNEKWIEKFKEIRRSEDHCSPIRFNIRFEIRRENSRASLLFENNYNKEKIDLSELFNYLDKIENFFNEIKVEVEKYY